MLTTYILHIKNSRINTTIMMILAFVIMSYHRHETHCTYRVDNKYGILVGIDKITLFA